MTGMVGGISLVVNLGILIVGIWTMLKGALPARLLKLLLGRGDYRTDPRTARLFGSLLFVPFIGFMLAVFWTITGSERIAILVSTIQIIVVIIVILMVVMWARQIRSANKASE